VKTRAEVAAGYFDAVSSTTTLAVPDVPTMVPLQVRPAARAVAPVDTVLCARRGWESGKQGSKWDLFFESPVGCFGH
jgi:hypothetical protein